MPDGLYSLSGLTVISKGALIGKRALIAKPVEASSLPLSDHSAALPARRVINVVPLVENMMRVVTVVMRARFRT